MTALDLVLTVKRHGVRFAYQDDGTMIVTGAERLPNGLRREFLDHIDDCRAVVAEHSIRKPRAVDVVDAARSIARAGSR